MMLLFEDNRMVPCRITFQSDKKESNVGFDLFVSLGKKKHHHLIVAILHG
jgi:hypothetical protein